MNADQALLFSCPLLSSDRLHYVYYGTSVAVNANRDLYQVECDKLWAEFGAGDSTTLLEQTMACLPIHVTRKLGLHASYRLSFPSRAEARAHIVNQGCGTNVDGDPMLALMELVASNTVSRRVCQEFIAMKTAWPFLEN